MMRRVQLVSFVTCLLTSIAGVPSPSRSTVAWGSARVRRQSGNSAIQCATPHKAAGAVTGPSSVHPAPRPMSNQNPVADPGFESGTSGFYVQDSSSSASQNTGNAYLRIGEHQRFHRRLGQPRMVDEKFRWDRQGSVVCYFGEHESRSSELIDRLNFFAFVYYANNSTTAGRAIPGPSTVVRVITNLPPLVLPLDPAKDPSLVNVLLSLFCIQRLCLAFFK